MPEERVAYCVGETWELRIVTGLVGQVKDFSVLLPESPGELQIVIG